MFVHHAGLSRKRFVLGRLQVWILFQDGLGIGMRRLDEHAAQTHVDRDARELPSDVREADLPAFLTQEPVDLLVCECAHFPAQVLLERLEHVHAARIAVVHVYPLEKYDVLHAARPELLFPADGDVIRV